MAAKTYEERIADLQKKQSQLKARENALKKKQAADEAKKRSHRLIELGAIIESVLGRSTTEEDKLKLLNFVKKQETNGHYFTRAMNAEAVSNPNPERWEQ